MVKAKGLGRRGGTAAKEDTYSHAIIIAHMEECGVTLKPKQVKYRIKKENELARNTEKGPWPADKSEMLLKEGDKEWKRRGNTQTPGAGDDTFWLCLSKLDCCKGRGVTAVYAEYNRMKRAQMGPLGASDIDTILAMHIKYKGQSGWMIQARDALNNRCSNQISKWVMTHRSKYPQFSPGFDFSTAEVAEPDADEEKKEED